MRILFILASLLLALPAAAQQVTVTGGIVQGRTSEDGRARIFEGIPFAAPPTGNNRWRAPQPVIGWSGVRDAGKPAPACLQNDYGWNRQNYLFGAEDCLTLDIRTPVQTKSKLPVMVWIHGGSNRAGSGAGTVYSPITDQGVVLVAIQYRIGIFGFLAHRKLAEEQGGTSGNYGLMDQIAALKWVRDNIEAFGGDPGNVTIFGESAGSQDVSLMLAAPGARGLFQKAIMQSGTPGFGMASRPLSNAFELGDQLDKIAAGEGNIDRLRRTSAHALLAADRKLADDAIWTNEFLWLRPTIDGAVLTADPRTLLIGAPRRPVIIGTNRFEFGPAKGSIDVDAYAEKWFGTQASTAVRLYRAEENDVDPRLGHLEGRMETDVVFRCPAKNLTRLLSGLGWPVWKYEFDVGPDDGTQDGALTSHAYEIGFIMNRKPIGSGSQMVHLQDYWTNFAKFGKPGVVGKPGWKAYGAAAENYVLFDRNGMTSMNNLRPAHCALVSAM